MDVMKLCQLAFDMFEASLKFAPMLTRRDVHLRQKGLIGRTFAQFDEGC